jgi:hypothetical protein
MHARHCAAVACNLQLAIHSGVFRRKTAKNWLRDSIDAKKMPRVAPLRLARLSITSEALVLLLIRHRAQMRVKRDPVPCPQRMFTIGEDLYVPEMESEDFAETGAGEKFLWSPSSICQGTVSQSLK